MTFQTSDVAITATQMRRPVMVQSLAAFIFTIGGLAFFINVLGSWAGRGWPGLGDLVPRCFFRGAPDPLQIPFCAR